MRSQCKKTANFRPVLVVLRLRLRLLLLLRLLVLLRPSTSRLATSLQATPLLLCVLFQEQRLVPDSERRESRDSERLLHEIDQRCFHSPVPATVKYL